MAAWPGDLAIELTKRFGDVTAGAGAAVLVGWTLVFVAAATARNDLTDI